MLIAAATDFSPQAQGALEVAAALARRMDASLALLHAIEPTAAGAPETAAVEAAERRMEELEKDPGLRGLCVERRVLDGPAEGAILPAALQLGADLVVVGSHGRRAPARWLLGSVAAELLHAAELPVLVVPRAGGTPAAWVAGERAPQVVVAVPSAAPPAELLRVARWFLGEASFAHVAPAPLLEGRLRALLEQDLRGAIGQGAHRPPVHLLAGDGALSDVLVALLEERAADLMVVGIQPRAGADAPRTASLARSLLHRRIGAVLGVPLRVGAALAPGSLPALRSVLVPTDLSARGNHAVPYACALAGATGAGRVVLLHVYEPPATGENGEPEAVRASLETLLGSLVPRDAAKAGLTASAVVVGSTAPSEAIVEVALHLGVDAICMGPYGRSTLDRAILGTVTEKVIDRFPGPVLVVR